MLKQPIDDRGNNEYFLKAEKRRIEKLNNVLGEINLAADEERILVWLCGQDDFTLDNIVSIIEKAKLK